MGVKERAYQFIKYLNIPISKFEEVCGLSNGYISSMRKGFGTEKLDNVLSEFPTLSRDWLLTGEGEMLKPQNVFSQPTEDNVMMSREIFDLLKLQTETIHSQQRTIEALTAKKMDAQQTAAAGCADVG